MIRLHIAWDLRKDLLIKIGRVGTLLHIIKIACGLKKSAGQLAPLNTIKGKT